MKKTATRIIVLFILSFIYCAGHAENGYDLWLRYVKITDTKVAASYRQQLQSLNVQGSSPTLSVAAKEIRMAVGKMLGYTLPSAPGSGKNTLIIGTFTSPVIMRLLADQDKNALGKEGFVLKTVKQNGRTSTVIAANTDIGVLYGSFRLLELLQLQKNIADISFTDAPKVQLRVLDHWDNLDGTIERGYAGYSIWDWQRLPGITMKRYVDYARANASIGINGVVLNNVNASVRSLTKEYLLKTAAIADAFRPYGIKVYLTAKFSAPRELGKLKTADPLDPEVIQWWKDKVAEIYSYIPDFGGFLVKANSEGQPGPGDYGRTHADGANMLAKALKPRGGAVMWRTFVYENHKDVDRAAQGYQEFQPLDGKFDDNVLVQAKYGPIDFQPREAFNPLFGAMPHTQVSMELEITQEYFGFATHLVYLGPLFQEYLRMDTHHAEGSIADVVTGKNRKTGLTGIAGVANVGTDINWCGHPFAQSNWYAFGKFAWNPYSDADTIAADWISLTFTKDRGFAAPIKNIMLGSRETAVNYMEPMGLNHIMNLGTHYGPGPWDKIPGWNSWDYHHADSVGLGFDRTKNGANTTAQYAPYWQDLFNDVKTTPTNLLLWFHHVPWDYTMSSGKTMWEELVYHYYNGARSVKEMQQVWKGMKGKIDEERFEYVTQLLAQQYREACWWRDGCVLYFQTFSKRPIPAGLALPEKPLEYYEKIPFPL